MLTELDNLLADQGIDLQERKKQIRADKKAAKSKTRLYFPVEAFPPRLQAFIDGYCRVYGSAPEHYGLSLLTTAAAVVGNACWVTERDTEHPPVLYSVIVDFPSTGKTPIIKTALAPIWKIEKQYRREHAEKMRELKESGDEETKPPKPKEIILNEFTLESVYSSLYANPRGVMVFRDEINAWIASMNQYRKGSDENFWMESWNGSTTKINRKNLDNSLFIERPYCAVLGGTQPGILKNFAMGDKAQNGFFARLLFSYPDNSTKPTHSNQKPDPAHMEYWEGLIEKLRSIPTSEKKAQDEFDDWEVTPTLIELDQPAQKLYRTFFDNNAEKINDADDEVIKAILGKFDSYCLRIALVLELMHWAEGLKHAPGFDDLVDVTVGEKSMKGAIALIEYFRQTAMKVVDRLASPADALPEDQKIWYKRLPDDEDFRRAFALELAKEAGVPDRTMARLLSNETLFTKRGRGLYAKKWLL